MNGPGFLECQQPINNENTTHAYMYRPVILCDQDTKSTYTHETTMTVSQKFNFPIKYSVVPNVIWPLRDMGTKLKHRRNFKINLTARTV